MAEKRKQLKESGKCCYSAAFRLWSSLILMLIKLFLTIKSFLQAVDLQSLGHYVLYVWLVTSHISLEPRHHGFM